MATMTSHPWTTTTSRWEGAAGGGDGAGRGAWAGGGQTEARATAQGKSGTVARPDLWAARWARRVGAGSSAVTTNGGD